MKFEIHQPCDERIETMEPRPGGGFCVKCQTVVIDLSQVTRAQAEQRMRAIDGSWVCVQLRVDRFGDAVFLPPPKRAPHWSGGLVLLAALTAGGCTVDEPVEPIPVVALTSDLGPPMVPEAAAAIEPQQITQAVPAAELNPARSGTARPTAEQRDLTSAKHRPMSMRAGGMHLPPTQPLNPFGP